MHAILAAWHDVGSMRGVVEDFEEWAYWPDKAYFADDSTSE
jgi:hypothetical protein